MRRDTAPAAPPRLVHLGLGAFHRAHQAWYTARADDAAEWGIVAFGGRAPRPGDLDVPAALARQDGLYTLVERSEDGDAFTVVDSIVAAHPGPRTDLINAHLADPRTAVVTLTITEAGYRLAPDGGPDLADPALLADLARLREASAVDDPAALTGATTAPGRLLAGLEARRRAGAGPIALVPCDNLPGNGALLRGGLLALAAEVDAGGHHGSLASWLADHASVISTSVDRITPRAEPDLAETVRRATGRSDAVPVVTEPFSDWVLEGEFPAGRPAWEAAGALVVDDVEPFESRKLWLLNGAHSLLAYAGLLADHVTVAQAIEDPTLRRAVEGWWSEAARHLPADLDAAAYSRALLARFRNHRVEHRLAQISADGSAKIRLRILPVLRAEADAGRAAPGAELAVAAWVAAHRRGLPLVDAAGDDVARACSAAEPVEALLAMLDPALFAGTPVGARVRDGVRRLVGAAEGSRHCGEISPGATARPA
ncbi:oxidoreductase [Serinibacter arcticus]|uniref:Oxidoreductase n=1 Tax=Serinibacter arcticus TaxID=1655435 RepID=A0A2U1ZZW9_9MICO|nr:oxidoreductase [Serinibacter arcticus]